MWDFAGLTVLASVVILVFALRGPASCRISTAVVLGMQCCMDCKMHSQVATAEDGKGCPDEVLSGLGFKDYRCFRPARVPRLTAVWMISIQLKLCSSFTFPIAQNCYKLHLFQSLCGAPKPNMRRTVSSQVDLQV